MSVLTPNQSILQTTNIAPFNAILSLISEDVDFLELYCSATWKDDDSEEMDLEEESEQGAVKNEEDDGGDGKKRSETKAVVEEEKEVKVCARSIEEKSNNNETDNGETNEEGLENSAKEVSVYLDRYKKGDDEKEKSDDNEDDDWGNNDDGGTEFNPESPTHKNIMDVDKEEDAVASSKVDTKEARGLDVGTDDTDTDKRPSVVIDEQKSDTIIDKKDATEDTTSASNENEKAVDTQADDAKEGSAKNDTKKQDRTNDDNDNEATLENQQDIPEKTPLPASSPDTDHPLVGATVYVYTGTYTGLSGKLLLAEARGWWTIDNPKLTGKKVQCHKCKVVDDGIVDLEAVRGWYASRGLVERMPRVVKGRGFKESGEAKAERKRARCTDMGDHELKRKIVETDFTGMSQKRRKLGVIEQPQPRVTSNSTTATKASTIIPHRQQQGGNHDRERPRMMRDGALPSTPALNPILLQATSNNHNGQQQKRVKVQLLTPLPASLNHLSPDTKIEIFNRKTGRIMRGKDAILLSDLSRALMDHAEYEPIIPPSPATVAATGKRSITSRVGRSGPNVRVSSNVIPQTRVRASRVEGRDVLVTGGEYRGLSGTIDSCIPGGWYLVSNLFKNDNLDVIISSQNLELIPEEKKVVAVVGNNSSSSEGQGAMKNRFHLKAAKLRLEAFSEEKKKLERDFDDAVADGNRDSKSIRMHLKKMDVEINKAINAIAKFQSKVKGPDTSCKM